MIIVVQFELLLLPFPYLTMFFCTDYKPINGPVSLKYETHFFLYNQNASKLNS